MKKLLLIVSFVASFSFSKAQTPIWAWAENSSGGNWENGIGLSIDSANRLYFNGRVAGTMTMGGSSVTGACGPYTDNPVVGEFDTSGHMKWAQSYEFSCGNDYTEAFYRDNEDNLYSGGIIGSSCCGMFVDKYDSAGNLKWEYPINEGDGRNSCFGITADNAGNVYITGSIHETLSYGSVTMSYTGSNNAIFLAKLDSMGNFIWGKSIYGTGAADGNDGANDIIVDNEGYVYFAGEYSGQPSFGSITPPATTGGNPNYFLAKYDTAGNPVWVNIVTDGLESTFGGTSNIAIDSCRNLYITGTIDGASNLASTNSSVTLSLTSYGGQDMFIARCDNNGKWEWANSAGGSGDDNGNAITLDKNSDVYVAGYSGSGGLNFGNGVNTTGGDIFIAKYSNGNGAAQWAQVAQANSGLCALAVDKFKYVYAMGSIGGGTATFGNYPLTLTSTQNIVLAKLDTVITRTITPDLQSTYCAGLTGTVSYTVTGSFNSGNFFTVQLSDSTGSFVNAVNIGDTTATGNGTINFTIPSNTPPGKTYLVRIVSSNPAVSSFYNGCGAYYQINVYPNVSYITITSGGGALNVSLSPVNPSICAGGSITLKADSGNSSVTELWGNGSTADSIIVNPIHDTTYTVSLMGGCASKDTSFTVTVKPDTTSLNPQYPTICDGSSVELSMSANGTYSWSPSTGLNKATGDTIIATPTATVTYTVTGTNSFGCAVNDSDIITVNSPITPPAIKQKGDTLISSYTQGNTWTLNDTAFATFTDSSVVITKSGWYQVTETNSVNGCSATSDSEYITGLNQLAIPSDALSIYPNPTSGTINVSIKVTAHELQNLSLQLTDVLGRTIYTRSSLNYTNEIDLSQLASGVYFVSVINKNGRTVLPVIKQ